MVATRKYESNVVQVTQQFAYALRWADGDDARLKVLRDAIQSAVEINLPASFSWSPPVTFDWQPPMWWRAPDQQLERAQQLWPNAVLPKPPSEFRPWTESEVLLLHVPDTFDTLWEKIEAPQTPEGYSKYRWEDVKADERYLRLSLNKREFAGPVWLAFDPEHGKGRRPDSFWGQPSIAASEVFSALIQFPEWSLAWSDGASAPNLSGYQFKYDYNDSWSQVPRLRQRVVSGQLELHASGADRADERWSSPSVRRLVV